MCFLVLLVALSDDRPELIARCEVDWIECNHYYDQFGKLVFKQLIFWEYRYVGEKPNGHKGIWYEWQDVVIAWRIVRRWPQPYRRANSWRIFWVDDKQTEQTLRRVSAHSIVQTWTQHDPEVLNRKVWPRSKRRGL